MNAKENENTMHTQIPMWKEQAQNILDVRPLLEQGGEPFVPIMEAAEGIQPGNSLVLIAPFEPIPLYEVMQARGFLHETKQAAPNEWVVRFIRQV
jgi:uncharacterized protein (DUF2249 family)